MSNKEWYDLFQDKFKVSRSVARKMLCAIMKIKEADTFYNINSLYKISGNVHCYMKERRTSNENN